MVLISVFSVLGLFLVVSGVNGRLLCGDVSSFSVVMLRCVSCGR